LAALVAAVVLAPVALAAGVDVDELQADKAPDAARATAGKRRTARIR
jgi:hypothetical protein